MKIHVKFVGLGNIYKMLHKKKDLDIEVQGHTLRDLVTSLSQKYGAALKNALLDKDGEVDIELRVLQNNSIFLPFGERMDVALNDGDTLQFMAVG